MPSATNAAETTETAADEVMSPLPRFVLRISRLFAQAPVASMQPQTSAMPATQAPETNDTIATDETENTDNPLYLTPKTPEANVEDPGDGKWSIAGIKGHRVDPSDPTRLQLRVAWEPSHGREWPQTWEPEGTIQEDAFEIWSAYATSHDCRRVLGENRNK
ncbi:hypothetical protein CGLO_07494 [Colletotrichum gloeosporioides Cg-14]|uniref:Chromo domain-containing protein n=1 Tax=Colletotrichum gloeosporioides (strain Cg-14) TaxID=1237896 RepID=T0LWQ8_COLGC|nr:hypothetical protein CGLO_07494 [Colletotrichum gloeosporioides Cg-14]